MTKNTWEPVEQTFETLKSHLHDHFTAVGTDIAADQKSLQKSVRVLMRSVEDSFTAVRNSIADPVVRRDLTEVGKTLRTALAESFDAAGAQARQRLGQEPRPHAHPATAPKTGVKPAPTARKKATKRAPAKKAGD